MKNRVFKVSLITMVLLFGFTTVINASTDVRGTKKTSKIYKVSSSLEGGAKGDAWAISINNIHLPYNRKGIIADVNFGDAGSTGRYPGSDGKGFLFSSGFFLSGYQDGEVFANAVASASLVEDYLQGTVADGPNDSRAQIYVVQSQDEPFGTSWQQWSDAVALGADFYDGDGDGSYNPTDRNGNGVWDPDEDRPDLIGDETGWTVYHDGVEAGTRRWNTVDPIGIEVRQSIFGFQAAGSIGNIVFVRFRFTYVGLGDPNEPDQLDDVYFGVWADPDIGGSASSAADDLVGSDIERNAGYVYNDGPDEDWGSNPPAFMIDFFSGPAVYIPGETFTDTDGDGEYTEGVDTPLDTAYSIRGQVLGVKEFPGAKNLGISSFVEYINGDPLLSDPNNADEARNFMEGEVGQTGEAPDPCDFAYGEVVGGVDCNTVVDNIWFNGDPVTQTGWINTAVEDQRMMSNTGPFQLKKNEEKEIMVAYVVGQGSDPISSITETRRIDDGAQFIFDINFLSPAAPPVVEPTVSTADDFIDIVWETKDQVTFRDETEAWDNRFEGYMVHVYKTASTAEFVGVEQNKYLYKAFDLANPIENVYLENLETGGTELLYPVTTNQLDPEIYADEDLGRIRLRITEDPFTGGALIKGKPYYFSIISYAINHDALVNRETGTPVGADGEATVAADYYLDATAFTQTVENIPKIIVGADGASGIIVGQDLYSPPIDFVDASRSAGAATGSVTYDVVEKTNLTGSTYEVTFKLDSSDVGVYTPYWFLTNTSTGTTLVDSSQQYLYGSENVAVPVTDGFIAKIQQQEPLPAAIVGEGSSWYNPDSIHSYYLPNDNANATAIPLQVEELGGKLNAYNKSDQLQRIELRFDGGGKAYRYVNGVVGGPVSKGKSFVYGEGVTADDTVGSGPVGKLEEGFVDVPFTAWIDDDVTGESRQLAVGFIERASTLGGNPDGVWDPDTNVVKSYEYIVIFASDYDPQGNDIIYKGGFDGNIGKVWADLRGGIRYRIPNDAPVSDEDRKRAESTWLDGLYVVGLEKSSPTASYSQGDVFVLGVDQYPYTERDKFTFTTKANGELTTSEEKELFDRVNVFPNPLFGFNPATSWTGQNGNPDEPFVTFSNLPEDVTISIYSLSGQLLRTLNTSDKDNDTSPYLRWNLANEDGLRVASGLYLAIVSSPKYGDKVLKFSIIMPQKQLQKF